MNVVNGRFRKLGLSSTQYRNVRKIIGRRFSLFWSQMALVLSALAVFTDIEWRLDAFNNKYLNSTQQFTTDNVETMSLKIEAEAKVDTEPCVLTWGNKLFIGTEDGFIKTFDAKLTPKETWAAHGVQPFALATDGDNLYSSSNDGGIKVWSMTGDKIAELPSTGADVGTLQVFDKQVYAGDEGGNIILYENNAMKATYNVLEEVKDLCFSPPFLFTVRDLYVTATEIKPEESKTRFMTRHTMEGRAPLRKFGNRIVFMSRDGQSLRLHDGSIDTSFKLLDEIKVSDMIITTLSTSGDYVWTGGWDGFVRRWKKAGEKLEPAGNINLGGCINSLVANGDTAYAAVTGGKIIHISAV